MGAVVPPIYALMPLRLLRPVRLHSFRWYHVRRGKRGRSFRRSY